MSGVYKQVKLGAKDIIYGDRQLVSMLAKTKEPLEVRVCLEVEDSFVKDPNINLKFATSDGKTIKGFVGEEDYNKYKKAKSNSSKGG